MKNTRGGQATRSRSSNVSNKARKKVKVFGKKNRKIPENAFIQELQQKYSQIETASIKSFADLPLCPKTLKGLKECGYTTPTEIQRETIVLGLQDKDILGAAQTGSGKTLAFLIPILELLYCKQWTKLDGVGALVITPTRELAYQIFETLRKVGVHHDFSAGLIIGGKDLKFERSRMDQCNIVICTPGRLLQHMDENPLFDCVNMQILILDEADRCLDMGFEKTMNAIIVNLPPKRQTLLFSATQTKSVKDLARLSLKDPCYVSVHEHSEYSTPSGLRQNYVICELQDKMSIIWSFIKNHLKQKSIIFFSTCKQVKYAYEIFCKLRPGTSLLALYGGLHQLRRMKIYESFCHKQAAVLFATDLVARGLDFPEVHWVVQADCPEDSATYIHRVGRTARFHRGGESLLLLLPSEAAMLDDLKERKIPIEKIEINPMKLNNPVRKLEAYLASTPALKDTAQRAFVSYAKSVFLMKNKAVFKIEELDTDSYSKSLGLAIPPRIRFLRRRNIQTASGTLNTRNISDDDGGVADDAPKLEDVHESDDAEVSGNEHKTRRPEAFYVGDNGDSDDGVLRVKRKDHDIELPTEAEIEELNAGRSGKKKPVTKAALVKKMMRKNIVPNKKIVFTEEGEPVVHVTKEKRSEVALLYENEDVGGIDIERARLVLKEEDKFDKQLFKEKVKAKHKEKKRKLKQKVAEEERDDFGTDSEAELDLSWLPDPDKIYGKEDEGETSLDEDDAHSATKMKRKDGRKSKKRKTDMEDEDNFGTNSRDSWLPNSDKIDGKASGNQISADDSQQGINKSKKRKLKAPDTDRKHNKRKKLDKLGAALSVNEAEELAMMLLRK